MKNPIAQKLIFHTVLFSAIITLIFTAIQLYVELQHDVKELNNKLEQIKISYLKSIAQSVWISDQKQMQIILDGITELPDIVYARVISENKKDIISGSVSGEKNIKHKMDLNYLYNNQNIKIGEFIVVASLSNVYRQLFKRLRFILLSNTLKISMVAIFIYFLFFRLITRHLTKISEFSEKHDVLNDSKLLTLDRDNSEHDEFDTVVESINDMHVRLHEQISEINRQKQYLSQTLNSIGDAVITTDEKGCVTRLNPIAEKLTGWTNDEAQMQPVKAVFQIVNASTRETIVNPVEKVLATGKTIYLSNHTTLIAKDGKEYQIADSAAPIRDGKKILGMVLVFNDVTEQYQLRKKLQTKELEQREILQSMVDAVITIDEDGIVNTFNYSAERLFGYSFSEIIGKNVNCLIPEPFHSDHNQYLQNYIISGKAKVIGRTNELVGLRKNKTTFPMRLFVEELPPMTDGKRRFIGSCTDLTQLKEHEEQLRRSQKMDALGKLTGGIAHDYNNMLGVVLGYAELLKDSIGEQPEKQDYIEQIIHAGERGAKLTKKLLAFSKNKSSDIEILNINTVLQEEQHMLEKTLTARIKLELNLENDLWHVAMDESELEDAILNISINAMHAIESNGKLTIETENKQIKADEGQSLDLQPGDYVLLGIRDSGSGMNEETKEKIFDPFYSTKGDMGTGLGLSQVYGFVKRCGGNITVETKPEQGSQFTLYFPRYRGNASNRDETENSKNTTIIKGQETILVVDDEPALLLLASEILSRQGYQVFQAERAKQALEIMESEHVDLLLSDIIMPEMDGYELSETVAHLYPNIKIQLASGFSDNKEINETSKNLQTALLQKPYSIEVLLKSVRNLLDS